MSQRSLCRYLGSTMSWDLWVINYNGPLNSDDFRDDCVDVLGSYEDVRRSIDKCLVDVVWNDARHGSLNGSGFSIEFSLCGPADTAQIGSLALHVYGGGNPVSKITDLCKSSGWQVIDCTTGLFLNLDNPSTSGWDQFQTFRDEVAERTRTPPQT